MLRANYQKWRNQQIGLTVSWVLFLMTFIIYFVFAATWEPKSPEPTLAITQGNCTQYKLTAVEGTRQSCDGDGGCINIPVGWLTRGWFFLSYNTPALALNSSRSFKCQFDSRLSGPMTLAENDPQRDAEMLQQLNSRFPLSSKIDVTYDVLQPWCCKDSNLDQDFCKFDMSDANRRYDNIIFLPAMFGTMVICLGLALIFVFRNQMQKAREALREQEQREAQLFYRSTMIRTINQGTKQSWSRLSWTISIPL